MNRVTAAAGRCSLFAAGDCNAPGYFPGLLEKVECVASATRTHAGGVDVEEEHPGDLILRPAIAADVETERMPCLVDRPDLSADAQKIGAAFDCAYGSDSVRQTWRRQHPCSMQTSGDEGLQRAGSITSVVDDMQRLEQSHALRVFDFRCHDKGFVAFGVSARSGVKREPPERIRIEQAAGFVMCARLVPHEGRELEESVFGPSRQEAEDVAQVRKPSTNGVYRVVGAGVAWGDDRRAIQPPSSLFNRPRWTEQDARAALAALARSRKLVSTFAAEHGLDPQRLYSWRRRLGGAEPTTFRTLIVRPAHEVSSRAAAGAFGRSRREGRREASPRKLTSRLT